MLDGVFSSKGRERDVEGGGCGARWSRWVIMRQCHMIMPIDTPRLWEQVALGEDTDLELKEARFRGNRVSGPRRDDLADELAAFANAGGGRLVLGYRTTGSPRDSILCNWMRWRTL